MKKSIHIDFNKGTLLSDKNDIKTLSLKETQLTSPLQDYYVHICNSYLVIYNSQWRILHSYYLKQRKQIYHTSKVKSVKMKFEIKDVHPLSIEKMLYHDKMKGYFNNEEKKWYFSSGITIDLKNI